MIRPETSVHLDGTGIDFGTVRTASIKPLARDVCPAVLDTKPHIAACSIAFRAAYGKNGTRGIQKAGTIGVNTIRICNDDVGFCARHFEEAAQLRGTVAHDLVHDDACGSSAEIRVPLDISGKLCIRKEKGVVEDGTTLRDAECLVVVHGDIIAVGACDLYERNPVCRLRHIGALRLGSGGVGDDVGGKDERWLYSKNTKCHPTCDFPHEIVLPHLRYPP